MGKPRFSARLRAMVRDKFTCVYCRRSVLTGELSIGDLTVDHFRPKSRGGKGGDNLRCSCNTCNALKGPRVFSSIEAAREFIRAEQERVTHEAMQRMLRRCEHEDDCWGRLQNGVRDLSQSGRDDVMSTLTLACLEFADPFLVVLDECVAALRPYEWLLLKTLARCGGRMDCDSAFEAVRGDRRDKRTLFRYRENINRELTDEGFPIRVALELRQDKRRFIFIEENETC